MTGRLPPAARTYWRLQWAGAAVAAAIAAGTVFGGLWGVLALAVGAVAAAVVPELWWRRWAFEVREEEVDLRHGWWTVRRTLVPIRRIQHVDTESGPLQSTLDLATVSLHTAAGRTRIPALTRGEADRVRRRVGELARTRDDV